MKSNRPPLCGSRAGDVRVQPGKLKRIFAPEDEEKMKAMNEDERREYKRYLIKSYKFRLG